MATGSGSADAGASASAETCACDRASGRTDDSRRRRGSCSN